MERGHMARGSIRDTNPRDIANGTLKEQRLKERAKEKDSRDPVGLVGSLDTRQIIVVGSAKFKSSQVRIWRVWSLKEFGIYVRSSKQLQGGGGKDGQR